MSLPERDVNTTAMISFAERVRQRATAEPDRVALIFVDPAGRERNVTLGELESATNRAAHALRERGVGPHSMVLISLESSVQHLSATLGAWRLGACVAPISPALPEHERTQIIELANSWRPTLVVSEELVEGWQGVTAASLDAHPDDGPVADTVPNPGKAICSGGSTGRPKIIIKPSPWQKLPGDFDTISVTGVRVGEVQLVTGKLYHNTAFMLTHRGIFDEHLLIVMEKFDAAQAVDLIERHKVSFMGCVPTMLQRIAKLPAVEERNFSSIHSMYYTGAAAPDWMREAWAKLVPPERQFDMYGAAEGIGQCVLRGDEWFDHKGTVGRPSNTEIRILGDDLNELEIGEVGGIYLRRTDTDEETFRYIGSPPPMRTPDGFITVGDVGYLDGAGYLHLLDRRVDMIVSGGANVYCAEVEQAITGHPEVSDAAVVGIPDDDWGHRVHAIVELRPGSTLAVGALSDYVRERLSAYKAPKSYEYVVKLPRDDSGKLRRSALVTDHGAGAGSVV